MILFMPRDAMTAATDIDINDNVGDDDEDDGRERTPLHH